MLKRWELPQSRRLWFALQLSRGGLKIRVAGGVLVAWPCRISSAETAAAWVGCCTDATYPTSKEQFERTIAPRRHRLDGFTLVFRSVAAVIAKTGMAARCDEARFSGPDKPRVTARKHRRSRRPADMTAYIPGNVAKCSCNCLDRDQKVVSGFAKNTLCGRAQDRPAPLPDLMLTEIGSMLLLLCFRPQSIWSGDHLPCLPFITPRTHARHASFD